MIEPISPLGLLSESRDPVGEGLLARHQGDLEHPPHGQACSSVVGDQGDVAEGAEAFGDIGDGGSHL